MLTVLIPQVVRRRGLVSGFRHVRALAYYWAGGLANEAPLGGHAQAWKIAGTYWEGPQVRNVTGEGGGS